MKIIALSVVFANFFAICHADPQIHFLTTIAKGQEISYKNVESGSAVYIASNDKPEYLKNIQLQVANNVYTADELNNAVNQDGSQIPLLTTGYVVVSTTNEDDISQHLSGFIYITTAAQAKDPNFKVYVANSLRSIQSSNNVGVASTSVVLNTNLNSGGQTGYPPPKTAYVSNIVQPKSSTLNIMRGFPSDNSTSDDLTKTIFMNPLTYYASDRQNGSYKTTQFFENIMPMHLDTAFWFIKATGSFSLTIDRKWDNSRTYKTTSLTSTGLIVSEWIFLKTEVDFLVNFGNSRTTGAFMSVETLPNQVLSIEYENQLTGQRIQETFNNQSVALQNTVSSDIQADTMTITGTLYPGDFYIQYFGIDGTPLPSTIAPSPTTTISEASTITTVGSTSPATIWTTTKSTSLPSIMLSTVLMIISNIVLS